MSTGKRCFYCGINAALSPSRYCQDCQGDLGGDPSAVPAPRPAPISAQTNVMLTVRVLLRPPRAGERGFFVDHDATADAALAALLADDGDVGWVAQRDQPEFCDGDRVVTVEVERVLA